MCVTTCPAEAIRVRDGKARIMAERCIDCGECIRRCPNHAKKAKTEELAALTDLSRFGSFDIKIALPAPSLYGQFPGKYSIREIHAALLTLGFDEVFPVAASTPAVAAASRELLDRIRHPNLPRPLISSSCPTIVKFIQIRFPTLLDNIVPVLAPMEIAGRMARRRALKNWKAKNVNQQSGKEPRIGCFFISPCAGKITEARVPLGNENSSVAGVFSMKDIHLPLLSALGKISHIDTEEPEAVSEEIAWGRAGGEAEATVRKAGYNWLSVDGMDQCRQILEAVEDGKLANIDFLELMACTNGCVGGPLGVVNPALARHAVQERERRLKEKLRSQTRYKKAEPEDIAEPEYPNCLRKEKFPARSALLLDPDYQKAMKMMDEMEKIYDELPGLDCGCCGAPNCHALAEDIVRGNASRTDCVIILKEQYRELLEKDTDTIAEDEKSK